MLHPLWASSFVAFSGASVSGSLIARVMQFCVGMCVMSGTRTLGLGGFNIGLLKENANLVLALVLLSLQQLLLLLTLHTTIAIAITTTIATTSDVTMLEPTAATTTTTISTIAAFALTSTT